MLLHGLFLRALLTRICFKVDPEMREEFEARQKSSPLSGGQAAANPLQNFDAAAWLAGSTTKKNDPPVEKGITR